METSVGALVASLEAAVNAKDAAKVKEKSYALRLVIGDLLSDDKALMRRVICLHLGAEKDPTAYPPGIAEALAGLRELIQKKRGKGAAPLTPAAPPPRVPAVDAFRDALKRAVPGAAATPATPSPPAKKPKTAPSPASPAAAGTGGIDVGKLRELKKCFDEGILTEQEFSDAKAKVLAGEPPVSPSQPVAAPAVVDEDDDEPQFLGAAAAPPPPPAGKSLAALARGPALPEAVRDGRLAAVHRRLAASIATDLGNTVKSPDLRAMARALDDEFLGGALARALPGAFDGVPHPKLSICGSNRMTATCYKVEPKADWVAIQISAVMIWQQKAQYAAGTAHVHGVPCRHRRDTAVLMVLCALADYACSLCSTSREATAMALFGIDTQRTAMLALPPPPKARAQASGVGVGRLVSFHDKQGGKVVGRVKGIKKNAQILVPDPTKRFGKYNNPQTGVTVHMQKWNVSLNYLTPATSAEAASFEGAMVAARAW